MPDDNSDKVNACLEQAKVAQASFFDRRNHEWYVSLALWAMLVGLIAQPAPIVSWPWWARCLLMVGIPVLYSAFWLYPISCAHESDKGLKDYFWKMADDIVQGKPPGDRRRPPQIKPWKQLPVGAEDFVWWNWGILFQILVTLALSVVAVIPRAVVTL